MARKIFKFIVSFIVYMLPFGVVVMLMSSYKAIVNRYYNKEKR
jgi:hypothetical protein